MRVLAGMVLWSAALLQAQSGVWFATLDVEGRKVDFRLDLQQRPGEWRGAILDGDRPIWSTSGSLKQGALELRWDYFDSTLKAQIDGLKMTGVYARRTRAGVVERRLTAERGKALMKGSKPPAIFAGKWRIQSDAERGAKVMEGEFQQNGALVRGTIQRVDGDFGTLTGRATGNELTLSHFDGIRATLIEMEMQPGGTLQGTIDGRTHFTAARDADAAKLGLPAPPDPANYVAVKNPNEPFRFRFQDLNGNWVSTEDTRFQGKAMIVTIMGSWCPNCHDEAEFLTALDGKYRTQGLEIVALGFEYTGNLDRDREQLRAFGRRHNVNYTVLLAGTTEDGSVLKALPQLANFGGYPATLYLDRSHRVAQVHAGFAGPANAAEHAKLKAEIETLVSGLISKH
ncbi:MAG: TlpA family protein disulfide reductase [Acidobacteria bacterium]|nr:TlpA family protein disulfide reductase [Acidobacteriota bacterium]